MNGVLLKKINTLENIITQFHSLEGKNTWIEFALIRILLKMNSELD